VGLRLYPVTLAVALHDSGAPPVLLTVNCVCAATQVERVILVGWTLRVAGTGVTVGDAAGVDDGPNVGEGLDERGVEVGAAPRAAVAVAALERVCDDAFEFEEELLLEEAEGARMNWTPKCCVSSASRSMANAASRRIAPSVRALKSPLGPSRCAFLRATGAQPVSTAGNPASSGAKPRGPSNGWVGASEIASRGSVIGAPHTRQYPLASAVSSKRAPHVPQ
jgi:hypothetical protein